jgi:hypothetical protein
LTDILGADALKQAHLPNEDANRYFETEEEREKYHKIMTGMWKTAGKKDYFKFGYDPEEFTVCAQNPFRI